MKSQLQELKAIYSEIDAAFRKKDLDRIANYIAPDWRGLHGEATVTRAQLLESVRGQFHDYDEISWPRRISEVRTEGDRVTVRAEGTYRAVKVENREDLQMNLANEDTWQHGPDGWQNIFSSGAEASAADDEEAAIRALEAKFASAFNAGNVDAIMKNYLKDESLVVFDVVRPGQHRGADAYREAWVGFFATFKGTPRIAIADLGITVDGNLGFSHSIQHVTGMDKQGHPIDRTVRVTDCYRKIGDHWLIALEHISVPVNPSDIAQGPPVE